MEKIKKEQMTTEYHVDMLDNGIVVEDTFSETIECESYSHGDKQPIFNFLGKYLWRDIHDSANGIPSNHLKVTVTIEER